MKVVLVTGASSGVGQATARLLAQAGYAVFGTSRDPSKAAAPPGVEMLALDVRSDASVQACVRGVIERKGRIDVLVNNAGYELAGAIEETSVEEAQAQFETNFFGVHRMVRAVLPHMREQGRGHIVNVSSLAGVGPLPFMGLYTASKHALEGYTEVLRHELAPFGIRVCGVEPGFLNTPMKEHRQSTAGRIAAYDRWRERALAAVREYEMKGPEGAEVAEKVRDLVAAANPGLQNFVGSQARLVSKLKRWLPERAFEKGTRSSFRLA